MTDFSQFRTPKEILEAALQKEKEAHQFYSDLSGHTRIDMLRDLAYKLKDEEYKHVRMLQDMITRINLGRNPL